MMQEHGTTGLVLVTGGTGTLGRLVVERMRAAGRPVRVLSRNRHAADDGVEYVTGDLSTGDGIRARNLAAAARDAGVRHLAHISVVGADRIPVVTRNDRRMFGYFESKLGAERAVAESGVPWTILRATQFHDLVHLVAEAMAKLPVIPLPKRLRAQPVDAAEVADRLVGLALGDPAGLVPEFGGPEVRDAADLLREYLRLAGRRRRPIVRIGLPGGAARAMLDGANLTPEHADGRRTWGEFLAGRLDG